MDSKVKILHVTFDMTIGGAQQVIRQLIENMDAEQFESEVVCIDNQLGGIGKILVQQGVKIHLLQRKAGLDLNLILELRKLIKKSRVNILHCHQYTPYFYGLLASIMSGAKVVFTEHGRFYPDYGTWKRKLLNRVFSLFTAKITSISEATKKALVVHENFRPEKIQVLYNGILDKSDIIVDKAELKKQFSIPGDAFLFGTISRLQPIKNQSLMIRAFKQIHAEQADTHLLIVGDGEIRSELESLVDTLGISTHVTFAGFQEDPYKFHSIIDVFLLPSFSEGTSMTLLEALSFSTPCVVTNVGGNPEIILDNECGLVVPSDDLVSLVDTLRKVMKTPGLMSSLQINARDRYLSHFTVDNMVNQFISIYRSVCPR